MEKVDFVFVVLCYRNTSDIVHFGESLKNVAGTYKVILVNAFYNEETKQILERCAQENGYDFLNIENKGYSFGNNTGIAYAKEHYEFQYCIVSNADIYIERLNMEALQGGQGAISGPTIVTKNGKQQNPYRSRRVNFIYWLYYVGFRAKHLKVVAYFGIALNKCLREFFLKKQRLSNAVSSRVFALHGSFIVFGADALDKIGEPFDEEMFLFSEEDHLACLAQKCGVQMRMIPRLMVTHMEDGSVSLIGNGVRRYAKQSYEYFYNQWIKNGEIR